TGTPDRAPRDGELERRRNVGTLDRERERGPGGTAHQFGDVVARLAGRRHPIDLRDPVELVQAGGGGGRVGKDLADIELSIPRQQHDPAPGKRRLSEL